MSQAPASIKGQAAGMFCHGLCMYMHTAVSWTSLEVQHPGAGDVERLGLPCPARGGVEGIHAFAARADHISHEASTVIADILEYSTLCIEVWKLFLHALPLRALQGSEQTRIRGSCPISGTHWAGSHRGVMPANAAVGNVCM